MSYNAMPRTQYGAYSSGERVSSSPQVATKVEGDLAILRIERRVDFKHTTQKEEWREYLEVFQAKHPQFNVRNLGALSCTYFDNAELARMLGIRYPKAYGIDRKKTAAIQRGFSKDFNRFRDSSLSAQREVERAGWQLLEGNDLGMDQAAGRMEDMWTSAAVVAAPNLTVAGGRHLAVDLSRNDVLHDEYAAIRDYLKTEEGFDLSTLTHAEFKPHLSILRSTRGIIGEKLTAPAVPLYITLEKPTTSLLATEADYYVPELDITEL